MSDDDRHEIKRAARANAAVVGALGTLLIEKGVFVRFGDQGFEGFLPSRRLRDWWTLNELGTALEAEGSGRRLRLGDPVSVLVDRVETARGRVDLSPAGAYS